MEQTTDIYSNSQQNIGYFFAHVLGANPQISQEYWHDIPEYCLLFLSQPITKCKLQIDAVIRGGMRKSVINCFFDVISKLPAWLQLDILTTVLNTRDNGFSVLLYTHEGYNPTGGETNSVKAVRRKIALLSKNTESSSLHHGVNVILYALGHRVGRRSVLKGQMGKHADIMGMEVMPCFHQGLKFSCCIVSDQERYSAIKYQYANGANIVVFVCGCDALPKIEDISMAIQALKARVAPTTYFLLLVNKIDLYQEHSHKKLLDDLSAHCFANRIGFLKCSAKEGWEIPAFWEILFEHSKLQFISYPAIKSLT